MKLLQTSVHAVNVRRVSFCAMPCTDKHDWKPLDELCNTGGCRKTVWWLHFLFFFSITFLPDNGSWRHNSTVSRGHLASRRRHWRQAYHEYRVQPPSVARTAPNPKCQQLKTKNSSAGKYVQWYVCAQAPHVRDICSNGTQTSDWNEFATNQLTFLDLPHSPTFSLLFLYVGDFYKFSWCFDIVRRISTMYNDHMCPINDIAF